MLSLIYECCLHRTLCYMKHLTLLLVAVILPVDLNPCTLGERPVCMQLKAYSLSPAPNMRSEGC